MIMFVWLLLITPPQIENLREVFMSAFLAQNRASQDSLASYLEQKLIPRIGKGDYLQVAFDGDRIIGFILYEKLAENTYYLAEMAVAPAYQNKGSGKSSFFQSLKKIQA